MDFPKSSVKLFSLFLLAGFLSSGPLGSARASWQDEWQGVLQAAKKEGKVVASVPTGAELRKGMEETFERRFGIKLELFVAQGGQSVRRIVDEYKAGIRYFDLHVGGTTSIITELLPEKILDPVEPYFLLPEVKDAKNWWSGHMWIDRAGKFIYGFTAHLTASIWYNATLLKPEEIRSYDDLLNPKWMGKIGLLDPRYPGVGDAMWSYLLMVKGKEYLKKLAAQNLLLHRNQRQLSEDLAKGKIALGLGINRYSLLAFIKAGLPLKPLPTPREGIYGTGGSGTFVILKNPPHPNATKVFVNWLLSKEGQEIFSRGMGQASRRLDVDTKWLVESLGVMPAKDFLTPEQYLERENQSEEKVETVRGPAMNIARQLFR